MIEQILFESISNFASHVGGGLARWHVHVILIVVGRWRAIDWHPIALVRCSISRLTVKGSRLLLIGHAYYGLTNRRLSSLSDNKLLSGGLLLVVMVVMVTVLTARPLISDDDNSPSLPAASADDSENGQEDKD